MNETVNFSDIIKKKFLEAGSLSISPSRILLSMALALALGLFIYYVYKKTYQGVVYNRVFNISLVITALVTALVMLPITSNLTLSLGMVGALSIIRFRTAVKDPIDIAYMFWAISVGITTGAGFYSLAVVGSLIISATIIGFSFIHGSNTGLYLLVVNYDINGQEEVKTALDKIKNKKLKTKTITKNSIEATYEIRVKDDDTAFVQKLAELEYVTNAALVSYNGDC